MEEEKEIKSQIFINDEKFTALRLKMGIAKKKYIKTLSKGKLELKSFNKNGCCLRKTMKNIDLKLINHKENDIESESTQEN